MLGDADLFLAFGDFQLGDAGFLDQVDQFLELAKIHSIPLDVLGGPPDGGPADV
jgi:hypothetical protein